MRIYFQQRHQRRHQWNNLSHNNNNNNQNENGINVTDSVSISKNPHKTTDSVSGIAGYVTVTKNRGRSDEEILCKDKPNLIPTEGFDAMIAKLYEASSTEGFNYVAVTRNSAAPALSDTTLLGEITADGLQRVQAGTIMQIVNTNSIRIEHTFEVTGSTEYANVQKAALFDASSAGNMGHIDAFDSPTTLTGGDELTVEWTIVLQESV